MTKTKVSLQILNVPPCVEKLFSHAEKTSKCVRHAVLSVDKVSEMVVVENWSKKKQKEQRS